MSATVWTDPDLDGKKLKKLHVIEARNALNAEAARRLVSTDCFRASPATTVSYTDPNLNNPTNRATLQELSDAINRIEVYSNGIAPNPNPSPTNTNWRWEGANYITVDQALLNDPLIKADVLELIRYNINQLENETQLSDPPLCFACFACVCYSTCVSCDSVCNSCSC